ncbi:MAG: FecR domain-containing protein, partial [Acinetobacter sp.]|nr:FecR domain-containing protein [Acinetobacter sp.]
MNAKQLQKEMALWIVRLNTDDLHERQQAQIEFEAWRSKYPEHHDQLDQMLNFSETMQQFSTTHGISSQNVRNSMKVSQQSKKHILQLFSKVLLFCVSIGGVVYFTAHSTMMSYYTADYKTEIGQMHSITLEDGSKVTLAAKSAIKLDFSAEKRQINLVQGDIYIDVAKDPQRPLIVHTAQADFKALGTRFIVYQYANSSVLNMLHSKVETRSLAQNSQVKVVKQGEKISADSLGLSPISELDIASTEFAWDKHQILADQLPLADLLTNLGR